jgi:hypothetical protein
MSKIKIKKEPTYDLTTPKQNPKSNLNQNVKLEEDETKSPFFDPFFDDTPKKKSKEFSYQKADTKTPFIDPFFVDTPKKKSKEFSYQKTDPKTKKNRQTTSNINTDEEDDEEDEEDDEEEDEEESHVYYIIQDDKMDFIKQICTFTSMKDPYKYIDEDIRDFVIKSPQSQPKKKQKKESKRKNKNKSQTLNKKLLYEEEEEEDKIEILKDMKNISFVIHHQATLVFDLLVSKIEWSNMFDQGTTYDIILSSKNSVVKSVFAQLISNHIMLNKFMNPTSVPLDGNWNRLNKSMENQMKLILSYRYNYNNEEFEQKNNNNINSNFNMYSRKPSILLDRYNMTL